MSNFSEFVEWLSLVDVSGPFLVPRVLEKAFPQGFEGVETRFRQLVQRAYKNWRGAIERGARGLEKAHITWIQWVMREVLEYDDGVFVPSKTIGAKVIYRAPEHGVEYSPDFVLLSAAKDRKPRLLVSIWPAGTNLEKIPPSESWPASPIERMTILCRAKGIRLGLVTNGECWTLVNAPVGANSGYATWYAGSWWQEPITLRAFRTLLGSRRFLGSSRGSLETLLDESAAYQEEVTDALGDQVRRAVETLVQAIGRADRDRNGELLGDVQPRELYEAALTVMMRMVFTLCAEERGMLLLGDPIYDQNYALSTLRSRLQEEVDRHGEEVVERKYDAWGRILAVFRAIHVGIEHDLLRLPALGGSLFDPDRFPLLEGRAKGTSWRDTPAVPLPIDNRTVLLLLDALQVLKQSGGARLLSYRSLDVEQIGHVYEGLLEYTVARLDEVTLGLIGSQRARHPTIALTELESLLAAGIETAVETLAETTGRSTAAIRRALERKADDDTLVRLVQACEGDEQLARRLLPFADLIREDSWDTLLVYKPGTYAVVHGSDRRETGTHYTPKSLTESIVEKTLEPLVYSGPAEGKSRERWRLKTSAEILDLKVCDPAMGSGAFLVQVSRYLAERLVEAWAREEAAGKAITADGIVLDALGEADPLPKSLDERLVVARRLIAERCLYGVDINPLAVELAKLSLWLVTMAKGRPFGFLDHNLHFGDSLLGIHRLDQLTKLTMNPDEPGQDRRLFGQNIAKAVEEALAIRTRLRSISIRDIRDVETMARLDTEARKKLEAVELVADAMIGTVLANAGQRRRIGSALDALAIEADAFLHGDAEAWERLASDAKANLSVDMPAGKPPRRPFHWPLAFPEVFARENGGFDAIVGNPPFLGGQRITGVLGTAYRDYLVRHMAGGRRGSADLVAYFFLRAWSLLRNGGGFGLLAVNTIAEGDTRQVGLEAMVRSGAVIHAAYPNEPWPGKAAVVTCRVHVHKGEWRGERSLLGRPVPFISAFLSDRDEWSPKRLKANEGIAFQGCITRGLGFVLTHDEARRMLDADPRNADVIFPYLNGEDLNSDPEQRPSRWVINFWDWPEERARQYQLPWLWIEERVKPDRFRKRDDGRYACAEPLRNEWWLFEGRRSGLYHAIGRGHHFERHPEGLSKSVLKAVHVLSLVSKHLGIARVANRCIFSHALGILASDDPALFAALQSSIHEVWSRKQASHLETRLRYTPSDIFETFPLPSKPMPLELKQAGEAFMVSRSRLMQTEQIGLTNAYNRFHSESDRDPRIEELRELQREMDLAVARAYGWDDLDLGHGFHEVPYLPENDRVRFTISESARVEVLRRLSELNRQRYEEEVARGLHGVTVVEPGRTRGDPCNPRMRRC